MEGDNVEREEKGEREETTEKYAKVMLFEVLFKRRDGKGWVENWDKGEGGERGRGRDRADIFGGERTPGVSTDEREERR